MVDVRHQINSVRREVGVRSLDAGTARVVTVRQRYDVPVEDVWAACTTAERIPRWFLPITGDLREGGRFQLEGNAGGTIRRCDPPNGFDATWEHGGEVSWIEVRFTAEDGGARLQLEHIAHVDDERWAEFGPGAVGIGWDMGLLGLATHLSTADGAPPEESAAWTGSGEGRRFTALSSEAWCEANIASGAPEAQAQAAADRTTAACTATGGA